MPHMISNLFYETFTIMPPYHHKSFTSLLQVESKIEKNGRKAALEWRKTMNMTRKRLAYVFLIVIIFALCSVSAYAEPIPPPEGSPNKGMDLKRHPMSPLGIWKDPKLVTELGLTDEQLKGLMDADFAFIERHLELRFQLDLLHLQMGKSFSTEKLEEETLRAAAKKIGDLMGKVFIQDTEARLACERLLTREQRKKLRMLELSHGPRGMGSPEGPCPRDTRHP
jgi:hypothetical protein